MKEPSVIFIIGPSGAGKSQTGLCIAGHLESEIVCCDAMQVYREVTIASDKPSAGDRAGVPHHLFDIISVTQDFNVARYRQLAGAAIEDIRTRGKIPMVVGGSGMYVSVLLDGIFEQDADGKGLREELTEQASRDGLAALHERLKALDPQAADKIHPNDPQRIIRALEVALSAGAPITSLQKKRKGLWGQVPIKIFALNRPRQELYRRVEARVEEMFTKGLVEEIRQIAALPLSATAAKIIGIPEVMGYLKGEYDLARAKYLMKLNTRHYIKRQLTWFRRDKRLTWIDIKTEDTNESIVQQILRSI